MGCVCIAVDEGGGEGLEACQRLLSRWRGINSMLFKRSAPVTVRYLCIHGIDTRNRNTYVPGYNVFSKQKDMFNWREILIEI